MNTIWYIHGANASPTSFNYIKSQLPEHQSVDISYSATEPIGETIAKIAKQLDRPVHIIAHSLGGVIAVVLSQLKPHFVKSIVTMGTPFGGSEIATRAAVLVPFDPFISNITTFNPILLACRMRGAVVPTMTIVTTKGGNAFETAPNDGVVTVSSQLALANATVVVQVPLNHFESLLCPSTIKTITTFHQELLPTT